MLKKLLTATCFMVTALTLAVASPANAAVIFSDNFNSGDLSAWSGSHTETGDSIAVQQSGTGNYFAQAQVDNVSKAQAMVWKNFTGQTTLYAQAQIYLPSSFSTSGHVTVMQFLNDWSNIISATINSDMTLYMWNSVAGEAYGYQATSQLSTGWHTVAMLTTISPTAGIAQLWLDGNLQIDATGNLGSNPINKFAAGIYWANPKTESNTLYIDNVWVGSSTPTPEPGTLLLLGSGLVGVGVGARRRNRRKQQVES
jgi:hypothetical protein